MQKTVIATASDPFFKLKLFPDNQKDVAVELLVDEAKKVENFRSTHEADKGGFWSGDEYFVLVKKKLLMIILATVAVKPIL